LFVEPEYSGDGWVMLHFVVSDSGVGIPEEEQEQIFQEFRQGEAGARSHYRGTGLGLAICTQLVSLMGGEIWLKSVPGRGSAFHFTARFEVAPDSSACSGEGGSNRKWEETASPQKLPSRLKILVVEDNVVNQRLMEKIFLRYGVAVTIAGNGEEALSATRSGSYDLILMDMHMPIMDGIEATQRIRKEENGRKTPILAMSASVTREDREACLKAGMDGYLAKPIRTQDLLKEIRQACEIGSNEKIPEKQKDF
jgi:CheY-like chemotaxis protein